MSEDRRRGKEGGCGLRRMCRDFCYSVVLVGCHVEETLTISFALFLEHLINGFVAPTERTTFLIVCFLASFWSALLVRLSWAHVTCGTRSRTVLSLIHGFA